MTLDFDDEQIYKLLLRICKRHSVSPSSSLEAEKFFREMLSEYKKTLDIDEITSWLHEKLHEQFVSMNERPKWLQDAEWPFFDSQPMIFVGQIDWHVNDNELISETFHDDTSFYLFISKNHQPVVITQQK